MKSARSEGLVLRAAIYCRKSTDDSDRNEELRSTALQEENARRLAGAQGWRIVEVFKDENVSGALVSRPALDRMLAALDIRNGKRPRRAPRALPFDVLIVRDQSRLTRNVHHVTKLLSLIVNSGVQLWYYKERRQVEVGEWHDLAIGVQGFVDSGQRLKARADAREGLAERALKGYSTGGVCYGYKNAPVMGKMPSGQEMRLYTDFKINEQEADTVRRIFTAYAAGYGPRAIAKTLNGDPKYAAHSRRFFDGQRPPKPRVGKRGSDSWAPTAVRDMLRNERYAGVLIFGRAKTEYLEDGEEYRVKQSDPLKIVRAERPDLRIVPSALWDGVQKRIAAERHSYLRSTRGELHGRPERGLASRYLFSGFIRCGCCGSSMVVSSQAYGTGHGRRNERIYLCNYRSHRGSTACTNALRPRMAALDDEALSAIEQKVLQPAVIAAAVDRAIELIKAQRRDNAGRPAELRRQLAQAQRERDNLVAAIRIGGGKLDVLVSALTDCEARLEAARQEIEACDVATTTDQLSDHRLKRQLTERCKYWRDVLAGDVPLARQALRALLDGPIQFIPDDGGYRLRGRTRLGPLFDEEWGAACPTRAKMASPRGFEPRLPP